MVQSPTMQEVKVESLERLETLEGRMRISTNAGSPSIVFPREVWENLLANAPTPAESTPEELEGYADEESCSVLREVPCGDTGFAHDHVLRPAGLFSMTTGYYFAPVVNARLAAGIGAGLAGDDSVEQSYVVGAVADDAFLSGDESLRVLPLRGRSFSTSRFEMPPELWQVLSKRLCWRDVHTTVTGR